MKTWCGSPPERCDICTFTITDTFIDGVTKMGPWAIMCPDCHKALGKGLGVGLGQRYRLINGEWINEGDITKSKYS